MPLKNLTVIALGGNALIGEGEEGSFKQQAVNVEKTARQIANLAKERQLVVTHGNGPQVGNLQVQMLKARKIVPVMPLDVDVAMIQGQIGYLLQQKLGQELKASGKGKQVLTIITQVLVSSKDKAFKHPTKPIGSYYSQSELAKARKLGIKHFVFVKKKGKFREVVASPKPLSIIELPAIKKALHDGITVIACGGGGIPVVRKGKSLQGCRAVIDKDSASALLAVELKAREMLILTDVGFVCENFGKKNEKKLRKVKVKELKELLKQGHFAEGSMKPKVQAAVEFLQKGGKKVVITHLSKLNQAIAGKTGTVIE